MNYFKYLKIPKSPIETNPILAINSSGKIFKYSDANLPIKTATAVEVIKAREADIKIRYEFLSSSVENNQEDPSTLSDG